MNATFFLPLTLFKCQTQEKNPIIIIRERQRQRQRKREKARKKKN